MIDLYIRYENRQFIGHPVLKSNLQELYPDLDLAFDTPENWIPFIRITEPNIDRAIQTAVFNGYKIENSVAFDDWIIENLPSSIIEDGQIDNSEDVV